MTGETSWLASLVALGIGLAGGVWLAIRARLRRGSPAPTTARRSAQVPSGAEALIAELARQGPGWLGRAAQELEAAKLWRDADEKAAQEPAPPGSAEQPGRGGWPLILTGAWIGATVVLLAVFARDLRHNEVPAAQPAPAGFPEPASTSAAAPISGTIELDRSLVAGGAPTGSIFVVARPEGTRRGSALMVARLPAGPFPLAFRLDSGHQMSDRDLPPRVAIDAWLDTDGDPMTRDPKDPSAFVESTALGSQGVKITLRIGAP